MSPQFSIIISSHVHVQDAVHKTIIGKFRIIANAKMMARQKKIQYARTTKRVLNWFTVGYLNGYQKILES